MRTAASRRRPPDRIEVAVSEPDAEAQAGPEDALVPVQLTDLEVVGHLRPHIEPLDQVHVEADLGAEDDPILEAAAVDAAEVAAEERPDDAKVRREIQTDGGAAVDPVIVAV